MRTHAVYASDKVRVSDVMELKRHAKHPLEQMGSFHQASSAAEAAAPRRVAALAVATGVALKIFGRAAAPGSPAAKVMARASPQA